MDETKEVSLEEALQNRRNNREEYVRRIANINSEYSGKDITQNIEEELTTLNRLVNYLSNGEIHGYTIIDGVAVDLFVAEKYNKELARLEELESLKGKEEITEETEIEPEETEKEPEETEKEPEETEISPEQRRIVNREALIKRQALLEEKYPNVENRPQIIQDELTTLSRLVGYLKTSGIQENIISSDGCLIDSFVAEKYEEELAKLASFKGIDQIKDKDVEKFEFPEIDFADLESRLEDLRENYSPEKQSELYEKLNGLSMQTLPTETLRRINELQKAQSQIFFKNYTSHEKAPTSETPRVPAAPVTLSKIAKIYEMGKGLLAKALETVKGMLTRETIEKNVSEKNSNENKNQDQKETYNQDNQWKNPKAADDGFDR